MKSNPLLSAAVYGIAHVDPSQSDAFPYAVKAGRRGVDLKQLEPIYGGPVSAMTLASTQPGFMWAIASDREADGDLLYNSVWGPYRVPLARPSPAVKVMP